MKNFVLFTHAGRPPDEMDTEPSIHDVSSNAWLYSRLSNEWYTTSGLGNRRTIHWVQENADQVPKEYRMWLLLL